MNPGITIIPAAFTTRVWGGAGMLGPTDTIFFPWISTLAFSKSPTWLSMLSTMPSFSRIARPLAFVRFSRVTVDAAFCWATALPVSHWAAAAPATSPTLPFRKPRRELPSRSSTGSVLGLIVGLSFPFILCCSPMREFLQQRASSRIRAASSHKTGLGRLTRALSRGWRFGPMSAPKGFHAGR
jgi:hypothetical protein